MMDERNARRLQVHPGRVAGDPKTTYSTFILAGLRVQL